jgi:hypothetical protein
MKKILLYTLLCVLTFASCDDFLDITPKGKKEPATVADLALIMNKLYTTTDNTLLMSDNVVKLEVFAADLVNKFHNYNAYTWGEFLFSKDASDADWNNSYANLFRFNYVINNVDNFEGTDDVLRAQTKGEALFQRAYTYFKLVNQYAKQYKEATASTDLGVPLRLTADIYAVNTRATVEHVYTQMIADLEVAVDLLSVQKDENFRPNKVAANILLAKVYLHQRKFELARTHASQALNDDNSLFDYSSLEEDGDLPRPQDQIEYPFYAYARNNSSYNPSSNGNDGAYFANELLDLYQSSDLRPKTWQRESDEEGVMFGNRGVVPEFRQQGICIPDAYLIRAECNARLDDKDAAMADVNAIRVNRFKAEDYTALTATDAADALDKVLNERRREMAFLNDRWYDMRRLDVDPVYQRTYTRSIAGKTFTLEVNSNRFVVAIPRKVILINGIEQNPR